MIKYLKIDGYKCYNNFEINFREGINLLVGENDAGKSSLLNVIRILKGELYIDNDDFRDQNVNICFEIGINGKIFKFIKEYDGNEIIYQKLNVGDIKSKLTSELLSVDEISLYINIFSGNTRLRNNKDLELKRVLDLEIEDSKEVIIEKRILFNEFLFVKFQDGKEQLDIQDNFKNFIKNDVNKIWDEEIDIIEDGVTKNKKLSELVGNKLEVIKRRKEEEYTTSLLSTIQEIIPSIESMSINLNPNLGNFSSFESKIDFLQSGNTINIDKKGDGTKRRISLALFKKESLKDIGNKNIYLFDEPDTHLNLRAQQDLINTFYKLIENGHQVIFTSHSPFILNLIKISNIFFLQNNGEKTIKLELHGSDVEIFNKTINNLGIQNVDIFFSKYFIFYEGETELKFFSEAYYKKYLDSIEKKFVRQIECGGINNEAIFLDNYCKIIGEGVKIISIVDTDYEQNSKTKKIIDGLKLKFTDFKLITLGTKEFEDEFSSEKLYECFLEKLNENGVNSITDLETLKLTIPKFSSILSAKTKLSKPEMGLKMAEFFEFDDLPEKIKEIIELINSL